MLVLGNVDMQNNYISNVVVSDEGQMPADAKAGRLAFNNKRLFVCIEIINGIPIWIPLTSELNTSTKIVTVASDTWVFVHNLNSATPILQIYDAAQKAIQPDSITIDSNNQATIRFGAPVAGTVVGIFGDVKGTEKMAQSYETTVTTPSMDMVVQHNLGYNPTVVVVDVTGQVMLPKSIINSSLFSTFIQFDTPFTGSVRFS
jgi:hypothetical protein